ncbi:C-8 sterol isomerase [Didymella pomorum]|uniref:C-8 sterol isomerase n=1 Tax=Didymella pomorum TaxID=749634 RepID=A0A9W8ZK45_9PLEO|nr:C-8 sterol isomerase [Didymella pomorum]
MARFLLILGAILGLLTSAMYMVEPYLEQLYIFTPSELHALQTAALSAHGNDTTAVVNFIVSDIAKNHPAHINLDEEWIFNNAGGAMGAMYIIHASITEYLIIFGTAIGTEGHTGRHTADDYFHILKGEQLAYAPGKGVYQAEVYPQGSVHHLRRGDVKQYKMENGCFALEYARGWIPPMLGFGYADSECLTCALSEMRTDESAAFFSTLDFPTLWRTTVVTGREMIGNLLKGKL